METLARDIRGSKAAENCRSETLKAMHQTLSPGEDLSNLTRTFLDSNIRLLDAGERKESPVVLNLFSFVRNLVTLASTDAVYGSIKNPFQDFAVQDGFW